ncbi:hypothetical protein [Kaistia adipata]|uniref:hypothetical protein n=1 Tax=Kaistia adipata TaxID=166954 RepID=UPI00040093FB|nr:hypothetical protein [Kaistia adipata]
MLFRAPFLAGIAEGRVSVAFRRWRRPTVKAGGSLHTAAGVVSILSVTPVEEADIGDADAAAAGFSSRAALVADLAPDGTLYRIDLRFAGEDERLALRDPASLAEDGLQRLGGRLDAMDAAARSAPWAWRFLELIGEQPGRRAADLAGLAGFETLDFKARVRRLKAMGLTESLATGYRLSATGAALQRMRATSPRNHG